jgi:hypothetical protein
MTVESTIYALVIDEPAELKQSCDVHSGPVFITQPITEFGNQHPLG